VGRYQCFQLNAFKAFVLYLTVIDMLSFFFIIFVYASDLFDRKEIFFVLFLIYIYIYIYTTAMKTTWGLCFWRVFSRKENGIITNTHTHTSFWYYIQNTTSNIHRTIRAISNKSFQGTPSCLVDKKKSY